MIKKIIVIISITAICLLSSCAPARYSGQIYGYFDTVVTVDGYFESEKEFDRAYKIVENTLKEYDDILDIYSDSEIKELNDTGDAEISAELRDVLRMGIKAAEITDGNCNIAMGSVLSLWHEAREAEEPYLPDENLLAEAAEHTDIDGLVVENKHAYFTDSEMSIDLGAIAKGYVADVLRMKLIDKGFNNLFVNLGGNVVAIGKKDGDGWKVGVQDPENEDGIAASFDVMDACLVTSGSYQRYFEYDGQRYHHIISPDTLYPSDRYQSVSVIYKSGAWADALSTALFNMSVDDGKAVLDNFTNIGAMWITADGEYIYHGTLKK